MVPPVLAVVGEQQDDRRGHGRADAALDEHVAKALHADRL
jgi:hypothetical protein